MIHLVAFADSRLKRSKNRLAEQANSFEIFDELHFFDENNLPGDFKIHFKDKLVLGSRGFGYWSWKPEIIYNVLNKINEGDLLLYVDVGCHLNIKGKKRLIEYFEILDNSRLGIVAFQANPPSLDNSILNYDGRPLFNQPNFSWIKGDLFDYFGMRENSNVANSQAIGAGIILVKNCFESKKIIREWRSITWDKFNLIDDSPSISPNLPGFIEHRHDQAIWTLLCLKYNVKTLSAYEYSYPKDKFEKMEPDWNALIDFPIHAKGDKNLGKFKNLLRRIKRLFIKLTSFLNIFEIV